MPPLSKSSRTDAVDKSLSGDWDKCYHVMHRHAIKIEVELTFAQDEIHHLRTDLERERAIADLVRNQVIDKIRHEAHNTTPVPSPQAPHPPGAV